MVGIDNIRDFLSDALPSLNESHSANDNDVNCDDDLIILHATQPSKNIARPIIDEAESPQRISPIKVKVKLHNAQIVSRSQDSSSTLSENDVQCAIRPLVTVSRIELTKKENVSEQQEQSAEISK